MKIERLSENQIRCTLNEADLSEKQLKISELAYGSPKAKELFRDMMQQASVELGFEAEDTPLMIEAIPVSPDCLVMIVTKVEDPEELDTRFSRFSNVGEYDIDDETDYDDEYIESDDTEEENPGDAPGNAIARVEISGSGSVTEGFREALEGLFNTLTGLAGSASDFSAAHEQESRSDNQPKNDSSAQSRLQGLFVFDSLATAVTASKQVASFYFSDNTLYKNPADRKFYLLLTNSDNSKKEFARACSILAEYGAVKKLTYAMPAYFKEHFTVIMADEAVQTLSAI